MNITARSMRALDWAIKQAAHNLGNFAVDSEERIRYGYEVKQAREALQEVRTLRKELAQGVRS